MILIHLGPNNCSIKKRLEILKFIFKLVSQTNDNADKQMGILSVRYMYRYKVA